MVVGAASVAGWVVSKCGGCGIKACEWRTRQSKNRALPAYATAPSIPAHPPSSPPLPQSMAPRTVAGSSSPTGCWPHGPAFHKPTYMLHLDCLVLGASI